MGCNMMFFAALMAAPHTQPVKKIEPSKVTLVGTERADNRRDEEASTAWTFSTALKLDTTIPNAATAAAAAIGVAVAVSDAVDVEVVDTDAAAGCLRQ
jgi:hypothetical protein